MTKASASLIRPHDIDKLDDDLALDDRGSIEAFPDRGRQRLFRLSSSLSLDIHDGRVFSDAGVGQDHSIQRAVEGR
jgi:hypothetical protein